MVKQEQEEINNGLPASWRSVARMRRRLQPAVILKPAASAPPAEQAGAGLEQVAQVHAAVAVLVQHLRQQPASG